MLHLLKLDEAGQRLRLTAPEVRDLIDAGLLRGIEVKPGELRIARADLARFIRVRRADFRPPGSAA
jgi:hypothetical protein